MRKQLFSSWGLLIILSCIWGFSYFFIKKANLAFSPLQVGCLRMGIAAVVLLPFLFFWFKKIKISQLFIIFPIALVGTAIPAFLYPFAQQKISSGTTGVINSLSPLFTFVFGMLFFNLKYHRSKMLGVLLGLAGAAILVFEMNGETFQTNMYVLAALLSPICYGIGANLIKKHISHIPAIPLTAMYFASVGLPALFVLPFTSFEKFHTSPHQSAALWSLITLSVLGTAIASVMYNKLIQISNVLFTSSVTYLMPVVAMLVAFVDGEALHAYHFVSLALILSGVYLTNKKYEALAA